MHRHRELQYKEDKSLKRRRNRRRSNSIAEIKIDAKVLLDY